MCIDLTCPVRIHNYLAISKRHKEHRLVMNVVVYVEGISNSLTALIVAVRCPNPPDTTNGSMVRKGRVYGDSVDIYCVDKHVINGTLDYHLHSECNATGEWEPPLQQCVGEETICVVHQLDRRCQICVPHSSHVCCLKGCN